MAAPSRLALPAWTRSAGSGQVALKFMSQKGSLSGTVAVDNYLVDVLAAGTPWTASAAALDATRQAARQRYGRRHPGTAVPAGSPHVGLPFPAVLAAAGMMPGHGRFPPQGLTLVS